MESPHALEKCQKSKRQTELKNMESLYVLVRKFASSGVRGFGGSGVREFASSGDQETRGSGVREFGPKPQNIPSSYVWENFPKSRRQTEL
jgi:hypothetical protein